jgi:hypothetical protein
LSFLPEPLLLLLPELQFDPLKAEPKDEYLDSLHEELLEPEPDLDPLLPPESPEPEPDLDPLLPPESPELELEPDLEEEQLGPLDILPDPEPEPDLDPLLPLPPDNPELEPDLEEELDPTGVQLISTTVTVQSEDSEHPLSSVTVNVYTVVAAGHTIIEGVLSPFDQL